MFGLSELAVILIVVIAVLAAKKLPDLARSAGKSARILKAEARAMKNEEPQADAAPHIVQGETISPASTTPGTDQQSARNPERPGGAPGTPDNGSRP
ncbi:twin-arginine translocase TatA/TatE family subunit [Streptomyces sp. DG2A-72]|uniref:twin-arginine translocase TatA/TatE family subunit n=1 Tax=Streptomyces sp. DG2A-72 TaxID=3051386 RepID=UPI00265C5187|nr:twin-arginine translocase TatA/TatE family subunit [Streptomyces sp. DG2A-72]MDO0930291.1 twin-arginine translocase TatA/TatE family subunit [Streptomyces sp. DG2A-72]